MGLQCIAQKQEYIAPMNSCDISVSEMSIGMSLDLWSRKIPVAIPSRIITQIYPLHFSILAVYHNWRMIASQGLQTSPIEFSLS